MLRAATIIFLSLFCALARAQDPSLSEPLPIVTFETWKLVNEGDEGREFELAFPSPVASPYAVNNVVPLRVFVPVGEGPKPVVLILHYWGASDLRAEVAMAGDLRRDGIASVLVALPYHLGRTPKGYRSGEMAIQPDPAIMVATLRQAVLDIRRAVDWIETRTEFNSKKIGLAGTSLGAVVSATVYGVEPRIGPATFVVGGVDIAHILWNSSRVVSARERLRRLGYTETKLREALVSVEPMSFLPRKNQTPTFVVGAKFDSVIPVSDTEKLIERLPNASTLWLDTGHYGGIFVQRRVQRTVSKFFRETFDGKAFVAPKSIYAPTVRLGASADTGRGFQLAVGFDLWRSDNDKYFASVFLSPRELSLFGGFKIDRGLSAGAFLGLRRQGVGLFWSVIL